MIIIMKYFNYDTLVTYFMADAKNTNDSLIL